MSAIEVEKLCDAQAFHGIPFAIKVIVAGIDELLGSQVYTIDADGSFAGKPKMGRSIPDIQQLIFLVTLFFVRMACDFDREI